jgi:pectinesterase
MSIRITKKIFSTITAILLFLNGFSQTKTFDKIIAPDGTGDYVSIKTAISQYSATRKVFFIKNGTYTEKVLIDAEKTNVRLIGESRDGVIITYSDYAGKIGISSTADSYTVRVEGSGFYAENITFRNTSTAAQAVAIYTKADTVTFKNCSFLGYQDTHYADGGRQYFLNCETRGDVDFIFGNAAVLYENSTIICRNRKAGYITAPSTSIITSVKPGGGLNYHGILFKKCTINSESGLADNSCYLGRPWGINSASVFYRCKIGLHIKPEGWSVWSTDPLNEGYNNHLSTFFAEYNNTDLAGNSLNIAQRVPWSSQVANTDTLLYTITGYFQDWNPTIKTIASQVPSNVLIRNDSVIWDPATSIRGYIVLRNDSAIAFPTTNGFSIIGKTSDTYRVKSVSKFGALSEASNIAAPVIPDCIPAKETTINKIFIKNKHLLLPDNEKTEIYTISGILLKKEIYKLNISLTELQPGIYILKVTLNKQGNTITKKIIL